MLIANRFSESIDILAARRLALFCAGLLKPEWSAFPHGSISNSRNTRQAAHQVIARFGYLQLDTVSIAGARSHELGIAGYGIFHQLFVAGAGDFTSLAQAGYFILRFYQP